jgi:hypothetical protein
MYIYEETTNSYFIESLMNRPEIYALLQGKPYILGVKQLKMEFGFQYMLVKEKHDTLALISHRPMGTHGVEMHIIVIPDDNRLKLAIDIVTDLFKLLSKSGKVNTVVTTAPETAKHAQVLLRKLKFNKIGQVPDAVTYQNKLQPLNLYSKSL